MSKNRIVGLGCLAVLVSALILAAGCGGSKQARVHGMDQDEVAELMQKRQEALAASEPKASPVSDPRALERSGDTMAMRGQYLAAFVEYGRALQVAKDEAGKIRLHRKMGMISLRAGNYYEAETQYRELVSANRKDAQSWQGLGLSLLSQANFEDAAEALDKAVALDKKLWKSYNGLGIIYNRSQQPGKALICFDRALAVYRGSAAVYNNRGLSLMMLSRLDEAEAAFERALRLNPEYNQACNNLALVYFKKGQFQRALPLFERTMGPAQARNNLGCLLAYQGQYQQAAEMFRSALEVSPTYYKLAAEHYEQVRYKADNSRMGGGQPQAHSVEALGAILPSKPGSAAAAVNTPVRRDPPARTTPAEARPGPETADTDKAAAPPAFPMTLSPGEAMARASALSSVRALRPPSAPAAPVVKAAPEAEAVPAAKAEPVTGPAKAPEPRASGVTAQTKAHYVQVASISDPARADYCLSAWRAAGVRVHLEPWTGPDGTHWQRVMLGPYKSLGRARAVARGLRSQGRIREFLVVSRDVPDGGRVMASAR